MMGLWVRERPGLNPVYWSSALIPLRLLGAIIPANYLIGLNIEDIIPQKETRQNRPGSVKRDFLQPRSCCQ
jgi:hypothetical protein